MYSAVPPVTVLSSVLSYRVSPSSLLSAMLSLHPSQIVTRATTALPFLHLSRQAASTAGGHYAASLNIGSHRFTLFVLQQ